jgi:AcrR family transcriptional regulator
MIFVDPVVENMPKVVDISARRRDILAAAASTFGRHGYRGTSLARVAEAMGVGKSSLYHYFPTKEALFAALADETLRREAELFDALTAAAGTPAARLRELLDVIVGMLDEWAAIGPLLVDFLREPRGRRRVRETFAQARAAVARLIREGQRAGAFRAGAPEALATVVLGCLDGLLLEELVEPGVANATVRSAAREMLLAALRGGRA